MFMSTKSVHWLTIRVMGRSQIALVVCVLTSHNLFMQVDENPRQVHSKSIVARSGRAGGASDCRAPLKIAETHFDAVIAVGLV